MTSLNKNEHATAFSDLGSWVALIRPTCGHQAAKYMRVSRRKKTLTEHGGPGQIRSHKNSLAWNVTGNRKWCKEHVSPSIASKTFGFHKMWIYRLSKELSASQGLLHADSLHGLTHTKRQQVAGKQWHGNWRAVWLKHKGRVTWLWTDTTSLELLSITQLRLPTGQMTTLNGLMCLCSH